MVAENAAPPGKLVPELEALLALWRRRYGTGPIPDRCRLDDADLAPWARHIVWIEAVPDEAFRLSRFGFELIRRFGREASNQSIDELALDIAAGLRESVWRAMATAAPVVASGSVQLGREAALFSELMLPMASEGRRIVLLLFSSYELNRRF